MFKVSEKEELEFLQGTKVTKLDLSYLLDILSDSIVILSEQLESLDYIADQEKFKKISEQLTELTTKLNNLID